MLLNTGCPVYRERAVFVLTLLRLILTFIITEVAWDWAVVPDFIPSVLITLVWCGVMRDQVMKVSNTHIGTTWEY
jgi:hypothetical protein